MSTPDGPTKKAALAGRKAERIAELGLPLLGTKVYVMSVGEHEFEGELTDVSFGASNSFPVTLVISRRGHSRIVNWENVIAVSEGLLW